MNIAKDIEHKEIEAGSDINSKFLEYKIKKHDIKNCKVGFFGAVGSFSEEAMISHFGERSDAKSYNEFEDVFEAVENEEIDYGVLPIENSSTGGISKVYDLLYKYNFYIVGEECVKIEEHLVGIKGTKIEDIKEVYSHEQPFAQSSEFLKDYPEWKLIPFHSTSVSAQLVKDLQDNTKAAITGARAAEIYGLDYIKRKINDNSENTTRFIIISKKLESDSECNKISVVFSMEHKAGALYDLVRHFAENSINMLKIESRPMSSGVWKYFLYVDFEGNLAEEKVQTALNLIKNKSSYFKLLGGYNS